MEIINQEVQTNDLKEMVIIDSRQHWERCGKALPICLSSSLEKDAEEAQV